jgi:crotonobetainyl-CoA:carnitine CoA-transferase CaiB-like acyl-CoA transferase
MTTRPRGALEGVRVLELGTLIAGPLCTRFLADFGAEVVKVEPPGRGDPLRTWGDSPEYGALWMATQSRNKKHVTLDLRREEGQRLARRLAARCDLVVENFRPGTLERWNLGYDALRAENPGVILVRISGFGQTGPYRDRTGFGAVGEAMGGLRYLSGYPDRPPVRVGVAIGDSLAALFAALGAIMALYRRDADAAAGRPARGQVVDASLVESVFAVLDAALPVYDRLGVVRERTGVSLPQVAPSSLYRSRDGHWLVIAGNGDAIFRRLMEVVGREDLAADPDLSTNAGRVRRAAELDAAISAWTETQPTAAALEALERAGVPAGPIYSIADIARDPHFLAREMLVRMADPVLGDVLIPGVTPRLSASPGAIAWTGPGLGAHNDEILGGWLGLAEAERARLAREGVI